MKHYASILAIILSVLSALPLVAKDIELWCFTGLGGMHNQSSDIQLYKYQDNLLFEDEAFIRIAGEWVPICSYSIDQVTKLKRSNPKIKALHEVKIKDFAALCRMYVPKYIAVSGKEKGKWIDSFENINLIDFKTREFTYQITIHGRKHSNTGPCNTTKFR